MSIQRLNAAADLRSLSHAEVINGLSFTALLNAPASRNFDVSAWRSLSNLIGAEWPVEAGLPSPTSWWAPRRADVLALVGGRRSMGMGTAAAAANLGITSAVAAIAEAVRPRTVLERAGAIRQEISGVVDAVAPEWAGGSGAWIGEGQEAPDAGISVSSGAALPKTAAACVTLSRRLVKQAAGIEADLAAEVRRVVAGVVEGGFFNGSGTGPEPMGILQTPGAEEVPFAGATPTYAELTAMASAYYDADADPDRAAWFMAPTTFVSLLNVTQASGTGQYAGAVVSGNRFVLGIRCYVTNHVPSGKAILADPSNFLLSYWRAPIVTTNPYSLDTSGAVRLTVIDDCDLLVRHRSQLVIGG